MPASQPQTTKPTLQLNKPKPTPAEKRVIEGGDAPKEKRLVNVAVYVERDMVERIDKACGKGSEIGLGRSMWIRRLIMRELEKMGV